MAEKLMKPCKQKVAPKKKDTQAKQTGAIILVGTYKKEQLAWIKRHKVYNYPITDKDELKPESCGNVKELWLYAGPKSDRSVFAAEFVGVKTRDEFLAENPSYAKLGKTHHAKYLVFKTKPLDYCSRLEDATVVARARDFAGRTKKIAAAVKAFQNSGDFTSLADVLPAELAALPRNQLRVCDAAVQLDFFKGLGISVPFPPPENPKFTFIDLFAGIGGIRLGYQTLGGKCVFSSEWDAEAAKTYSANFGEQPFGDITKINPSSIPDFDILLAGFPCQPFSIIGDKKGFNHETQGTLFFNIEKILLTKKPKAFMLENVRNLTAHDGGHTFKVILAHLCNAGYDVHYKVLNALDYGVPQKRERIIICGFRKKVNFEFPPPFPSAQRKTIADIIDRDAENDKTLFVKSAIRESRLKRLKNKCFPRPYISHENVAGSITPHAYSCALRAGASANYILINDERRPSAREMLRIQGFPDEFKVVVSYTQIKHQTGNSVAVPVIRAVAERVIEKMKESEVSNGKSSET